ncbi:MAG: tetratricopeptide repeat protein [Gemmatimonadota bacterium]
MSESFSLDELSRLWRESPDQAPFAALAEGLRKRGDHAAAATVALQGLAAQPGNVPGLIVLSRIRLDQGDGEGAQRALRDGLASDPGNPVVLRALELFDDLSVDEPAAEVQESDELFFTDDEPPSVESDPLLTESLAVLYHRQGHLERASEVYSALLDRDPENADLRARRDRIAAEAETRRPRPYDAAVSGGRSLQEWLAGLAAVTPPSEGYGTAYDAFYKANPTANHPDDLADFAAFQSWLKGLPR